MHSAAWALAETNIHYPTESSLILDGLRKILRWAPELASLLELTGWRQHKSLWKKAKKAGREIGCINKDGDYQVPLQKSYGKLLDIAQMVLSRTQELLDEALQSAPTGAAGLLAGEAAFLQEEPVYWHAATTQVCSTAERGRDAIAEKQLRPIAAIPNWRRQRQMWRDLLSF